MPRRRGWKPEDEQLAQKDGLNWPIVRATWQGVSDGELQRRHQLAQRLIKGRLPAGYLQGESTSSLFDG